MFLGDGVSDVYYTQVRCLVLTLSIIRAFIEHHGSTYLWLPGISTNLHFSLFRVNRGFSFASVF